MADHGLEHTVHRHLPSVSPKLNKLFLCRVILSTRSGCQPLDLPTVSHTLVITVWAHHVLTYPITSVIQAPVHRNQSTMQSKDCCLLATSNRTHPISRVRFSHMHWRRLVKQVDIRLPAIYSPECKGPERHLWHVFVENHIYCFSMLVGAFFEKFNNIFYCKFCNLNKINCQNVNHSGVICSVQISLEFQERSKITIEREKSIYSAKWLIIWHRDISS